MAEHEVIYGSVGPFFYDDTDLNDDGSNMEALYSATGGFNVNTGQVQSAPVNNPDVVRLVDLNNWTLECLTTTNSTWTMCLTDDGSDFALTFLGGAADVVIDVPGDVIFSDLVQFSGGALFPDNINALFGTDSDSRIYHNNSNLIIDNDTGETRIGSDGGASNYLAIESDGTIEFNGNATVWEDLRVPLSAIKRLGFTDPDWVKFKDDGGAPASTGVYALAFDSGSDEEVFFACQIPHAYKEGSDITPHVHWAPSDGNAGGVTWGLEYTWVNIDGTFGNTTIITADDSTNSTSHEHLIAGFSAISGSGKTISSMLICRLFRDVSDANDTYGSDAFLLEIDFHFELDTVGSRQILSK